MAIVPLSGTIQALGLKNRPLGTSGDTETPQRIRPHAPTLLMILIDLVSFHLFSS